MKSYFCFIREFGSLKPGSFVYHVSVGTSWREQAKLRLIEEFSKDTCAYFKRWSREVDSSLENAAKPFKAGRCFTSSPFRHPHVSVSQLYQMIIDDSFTSYEANYQSTPFEIWLSFHDHPDFLLKSHHKQVLQNALPYRRKNLSLGRLTDAKRAVLAVGGIILLMLIDAFMCNTYISF